MRDGRNSVRPQPKRLFQALLVSRASDDAVLWKRCYLDIDIRLVLLLDFKYGLQRRQIGIADINHRPQMLYAISHIQLQRPLRPLQDVLLRERRFARGPDPDPFGQRTALIPDRTARGQCSIQMNMRLRERRQQQPAPGVERLLGDGSFEDAHRSDHSARNS
ncbi:hypothetical protein D3C81_1405560 [compost metagenome]